MKESLERLERYDPGAEYDMAAEWCAKRGLKGEVGDPLPPNLGAAAFMMIADDLEAFGERVRASAYALAMAKHEPQEDA